MVLRVSAKVNGKKDVDIKSIKGGEHASDSGIEHGVELADFAGAIAKRDDQAMAQTRDALTRVAGPEALVEAAAVAANFQRMTRIADATGIPLDGKAMVMSHSVRNEIGVESFASAKNSKPLSAMQKAFASVFGNILVRFIPLLVGKKE